MEDVPIPVNIPRLCGNEGKYLQECVDTTWVSSEGPFVTRFEDALAAQCKRKYGVACSSGTAALELAFNAIGLREGDEVIMPTLTIISCILPIVRAGAVPVLVDSDESFNMDVRQVVSRINGRTKAILVVHIFHFPCDIAPVVDAVKGKSIFIIEDAAEMIGQTYRGEPCGSFGDISVTSFYPNKTIVSGEGGMVLTNNSDLANHCRSACNLHFEAERRFVHHALGWNYRMSNLQAAVGLAQAECLDQSVTRKREIGSLYTRLLAPLDGTFLRLPRRELACNENIYWVFGVEVLPPFTAAEVMQELGKMKVGTRPMFWPMHQQPVFKDQSWIAVQCPIAERLAQQVFYLPSGLGLDLPRDVEEVCRRVHQVYLALRERNQVNAAV